MVVHTWADGFGIWHARVTTPVETADAATMRAAACAAILTELHARGDAAGYMVRVTADAGPTFGQDDDGRPVVSVEYAEAVEVPGTSVRTWRDDHGLWQAECRACDGPAASAGGWRDSDEGGDRAAAWAHWHEDRVHVLTVTGPAGAAESLGR